VIAAATGCWYLLIGRCGGVTGNAGRSFDQDRHYHAILQNYCAHVAGRYLSDGYRSQGVSSIKLARDLGITQKSAWHMNHRIRKAFEQENPELLGGILEVGETYIEGQ